MAKAKNKTTADDYVIAPADAILQRIFKANGRNLVKKGPDSFDELSRTGTVVRAGMTAKEATVRASKFRAV